MTQQQSSRYLFSVIRERMRNHPRPVLDFAVGDELRREHPEALADLLRDGGQRSAKRRSREEADEFAEAAALYLHREYLVSVAPEAILPAPGGRYALTALASCILSPGDACLATEPGYPAFARVAAFHHARVVTAELDPQRGFAPDLKGISDGDASDVRLVALNYPNNPSGAALHEHIVAACLDRFGADCVYFNDAAYGPLTFDGQGASLLGIQHQDMQILELHTLGKLFALGPLGAAFLVGSENLIQKLRTYTDYAWTPLSSFHVNVASLCLNDPFYLESVRDFFRAKIDRLRTVLLDLGLQPYPTPAGLYVLCQAPGAVDGEELGSAEAVAGLLLDRYDLATVPWDVGKNRYLRFTALYREEALEALSALSGRIQLLPRRDS